ncbi:MAG: adenylate kinase [Anaerolineae bacterium]
MFLILFGAPGAGKGTQTALLSQILGIAPVSSGDLFRENIRQQTELGRQAKYYIDRGELVPDEVTVGMVMQRLEALDCAPGAILDGFPRTIPQAEALRGALAEQKKFIRCVVDLQVEHETLIERLGGRWVCRKCGASYHMSFHPPAQVGVCDACGGELYQRVDDRPETIEHRLEVYYQQTAPLQEYYRSQGLLMPINGEQSIEEVQEMVLRALGVAIPSQE